MKVSRASFSFFFLYFFLFPLPFCFLPPLSLSLYLQPSSYFFLFTSESALLSRTNSTKFTLESDQRENNRRSVSLFRNIQLPLPPPPFLFVISFLSFIFHSPERNCIFFSYPFLALIAMPPPPHSRGIKVCSFEFLIRTFFWSSNNPGR